LSKLSKPVKLLIVSDSHGNNRGLAAVIKAEQDADALLFLGDGLIDLASAQRMGPCPQVYEVRGNCDYDRTVPSERLVGFGGLLIFFTHGNGYEVKMTTGPLRKAAAERGADIVLFGHTHSPYYAYTDGIHLFNPGSISVPRVGRPTYGVLTITDGEPEFVHKEAPL